MSEEPINKVLYPLQRFKVLGFLCQVESSNYGSIGEFTGLSVSDISKTIRTLEDHGYVMVRKTRRGRYPETLVRATELGQSEMKKLLRGLKKYGHTS
ncbi:transcriptional regulator [Cryobacterium sp. PH31-O1]|uniref:transcriptional regulator n=1 Tax=Cryobacterium sp. PH31-O1 TaxID=3046306 RepID=UPI0024BA2846|nr:transcriptional regulator [Cryobacterium sp. PH31-O1]MDJ0336624.1 transcriptional regulator [Cryobacterium sp. PH31-O1]